MLFRSLVVTDTQASEDALIEEMGPVDYMVIEWPGKQPTGEGTQLILELADRGIIRILDVALLAKDEDGTAMGLDLEDLGGEPALQAFAGAASGILGDDDLAEAAQVLTPGTSAAVLVWENRWAAPVATALRKSGGQLVASGRIPIQAMIAALDAVEAAESEV